MRRRAALALAVGTIASLALAEGVLRAVGYHGISPASNITYDRELGWTLAPNRHEWESGLDYGVWATTDADGLQSVILDQVTNGLAVRMAVLYLCGGIAA